MSEVVVTIKSEVTVRPFRPSDPDAFADPMEYFSAVVRQFENWVGSAIIVDVNVTSPGDGGNQSGESQDIPTKEGD